MSKRFFKKSENIWDISDREIDKFIHENELQRKVTPNRVKDFYNALSNVMAGKEIEMEDKTDYSQFNCVTSEDYERVNTIKVSEKEYLKRIDPSLLGTEKLMKAASALAYKYEKEHYGGPSDPKTSDPNQYLKNLFSYSEEEQEGEMPSCSFSELMEMDLKFMSYIALLSKRTAFNVKPKILTRDNSGRIVRYSQIEEYGDISKANMIDTVMPTFGRKYLQKDIYVKTRFKSEIRAQNLIILIDDSGSMNSDTKRAMLKAIITMKVKDIDERNNVYIGTFEDQLFGFKKIVKKTTFENLIESFICLNKGGTDVNGAVKETIKHIKERKLPEFKQNSFLELSDDHFEVMVVNDGEDHVDKAYHPDIKLHAITLLRMNPDLKNICHRSGGTYTLLNKI